MTRRSLHWLASYPKSGNTWKRLFLANYFHDGDDSLDINTAIREFYPLQCTATKAYEDAVGFVPPKAPDHWRVRPVVQQFLADLGTDIVVKTHSANLVFDGSPMFDWSLVKTAILTIRDPRDIVPSWANHYDVSYEEAFENISDPDHGLCDGGVSCFISSWDRHLESWKNQASIVLRYEDLPDAFEGMLEVLGLPKDERFDRAVHATRIEKLRLQEVAMGFDEARGRGPFFSGERSPAPPELRAKIEEHFGQTMKEFGYV